MMADIVYKNYKERVFPHIGVVNVWSHIGQLQTFSHWVLLMCLAGKYTYISLEDRLNCPKIKFDVMEVMG